MVDLIQCPGEVSADLCFAIQIGILIMVLSGPPMIWKRWKKWRGKKQ